jgi:hypothetical protein
MSAELIESIKQQSTNLSAREKYELGHYLIKQSQTDSPLSSESSDPDSIRIERQQRMNWLRAHREGYAGKYVALVGDRLVGQGKTMAEALEQAHQEGISDPFLMRVSSANEILFAGW